MDHLWPFFCQMYVHLSQNWDTYGKTIARNGHIALIYESVYSMQMQKLWRQINQQPCFFFMSSSQIFVKTGLLRKTKSKNFQYFSLKTKKRLRKIQTLPSTTRQCHIRFGNGQTIGNLGVYHRFRSLEYWSRKSGTKTQSYCQSRRTWLEITFGTSK